MGRMKDFFRDNNIFLILFAVLLYAVLRVDYFTVPQNIVNLLVNTSFFGIVAIGMSFVLLTGAVDLSMGMNVATCSIVCIRVMNEWGILAGLIAGILTGMCIGLINSLIIIRMHLNPLIATLATMTALRGVALLLSFGEAVNATNPAYMALYSGTTLGIKNPIIVCAVLLVVSHLFLRRTRLGNSIYVLGGNAEAGRMAGINIERVRIIVYMLVGLFAGLGGFAMGARTSSGSIILVETLNLEVISACVIGGIKFSGGKGNVLKMIFGVLFIQLITNTMSLKGIIGSWQTLITGTVLVAVLILDKYTQRKQSGFAALR